MADAPEGILAGISESSSNGNEMKSSTTYSKPRQSELNTSKQKENDRKRNFWLSIKRLTQQRNKNEFVPNQNTSSREEAIKINMAITLIMRVIAWKS